MTDAILIYTDGACSGNPGPGGWGAILLLPEGRVRELGGGERPTTNNRMEMLGAVRALEAVASRPEPVKLYTDSGYLIQGITSWIAGWRRKGWRTMEGKPVLNRDLWEPLDVLAKARGGGLSWAQVKGHCGHELNERCDEIAVAFSQGRRAQLYDGPAVGCGYSLLEPGPEQLREPSARRGGAPSKPKPKGGFYVSLVDGRAERHQTWPQCQERVHGVSGARFKKVSSSDEEEAVLRQWGAK
ncbi:MAG: ribonuclease HI [Elusimicrobia bacterium]|nr:ribonuclease HI [Elusimicrobiota bacterium]